MTDRSRIGVGGWIGALLFFAFAALQYNDPDPIRWSALYGSAGLACLFARRLRSGWLLPAAVGLAALGWAVAYLPAVPRMAFSHLVESMKAENPSIEEARELLGLLIVVVWMGALTLQSRRARLSD
jgi:hypothetical protein